MDGANPLPLGGVGGGKYDNALMGILQDCVKLPVFLDNIFSFLARRTDFYVIMEPGNKDAKMGFLQGESEAIVSSVSQTVYFYCAMYLIAKSNSY